MLIASEGVNATFEGTAKNIKGYVAMRKTTLKLKQTRGLETSKFSILFRDFSAREKKQVLRKALKGANRDQKALIESYKAN